MIELRLRGVSFENEVRLPPSKIYRIEGPDLIGPDGAPIVRHTAGSWWADDICYTALYTDSRCVLHFENSDARSPTMGPYDHLRFADGMLRAEADGAHLLATLIDAFRMWALRSNGDMWSRVVLTCAAT